MATSSLSQPVQPHNKQHYGREVGSTQASASMEDANSSLDVAISGAATMLLCCVPVSQTVDGSPENKNMMHGADCSACSAHRSVYAHATVKGFL